MPNFGPGEILLVVGAVVLLFGAKRLPEIARSLGKAKNEFRKGLRESDQEKAEAPQGEAREAKETEKAE